MSGTAIGMKPVRNPFEGIGAEYDAWYDSPLGTFVEETELELLFRVLAPQSGETVLDIGAGTGRVAERLSREHGARVLAVEPSDSMRLEGVRRTAGLDVRWVAAEAESLDIESGSADAALLVTVLEFATDPATAVQEAKRVIRPGGRLVVAALNALSPWTALYRSLGDEGVQPWACARYWSRESLAGLTGTAVGDALGALYAAPAAEPPFAEADSAGRRAGNAPAFIVARWEKQ